MASPHSRCDGRNCGVALRADTYSILSRDAHKGTLQRRVFLDASSQLGLFRRVRWRFRGRWHGFLEVIGYEDAGYGNSTERKRNIEADFGRKD